MPPRTRCWRSSAKPAAGSRRSVASPRGVAEPEGRTFRLKGKGLKSKSATGDLLATVRIVLPAGADDELKELMHKWRAQKPYDPREDLD